MHRAWAISILFALVAAVAPARADTSSPSANPADLPSVETLRAVHERRAQLRTSPSRGLLVIYDDIDGETGEHDRRAKTYCNQKEVNQEIEVLVKDDLPHAITSGEQYQEQPSSSNPILKFSCKAGKRRISCSGYIGRDDGGPGTLEMVFLRNAEGRWLLDAVVRWSPYLSRRYIEAQLAKERVCR
jgi:hypothetical protein